MIESNLLHSMNKEFHSLNRRLTYMTVVLVCILAMIFWATGLQVAGKNATIVGVFFMLLALFTFKIPQISYRYMHKKYKNNPENLSILGSNWREFRDRAMQRK